LAGEAWIGREPVQSKLHKPAGPSTFQNHHGAIIEDDRDSRNVSALI
jgi:hypothetical protein